MLVTTQDLTLVLRSKTTSTIIVGTSIAVPISVAPFSQLERNGRNIIFTINILLYYTTVSFPNLLRFNFSFATAIPLSFSDSTGPVLFTIL